MGKRNAQHSLDQYQIIKCIKKSSSLLPCTFYHAGVSRVGVHGINENKKVRQKNCSLDSALQCSIALLATYSSITISKFKK